VFDPFHRDNIIDSYDALRMYHFLLILGDHDIVLSARDAAESSNLAVVLHIDLFRDRMCTSVPVWLVVRKILAFLAIRHTEVDRAIDRYRVET
jgi:hypothetical protein